LDDDMCFQSVTVVYEYTLELVTRKGLRVFAMDACLRLPCEPDTRW
jgi:hypothetical protein